MPTIVPLTPEAAWLPALLSRADWALPFVPTLVLAPHPDDETLGVGGLIAKLCREGVPVTIVAITDGEDAYPDTPHLGEIRILEQTEALRRLGVPERRIHRLHLPDRDVSRYEKELVDLLLPLVTARHAPCRTMAARLSSRPRGSGASSSASRSTEGLTYHLLSLLDLAPWRAEHA